MSHKTNHDRRIIDIIRFYEILDELDKKVGGPRTLGNCNGKMTWPERGVYFFFEAGEKRSNSGAGPRLVRAGTHALIPGAKSKLWKRLHQHRGPITTGAGNHRGSVFRWHLGTALIKRDHWHGSVRNSWTERKGVPLDTRHKEKDLEQAVSAYIRKMPFLWLEVDDKPGPDSMRGYIERNAIALLSNFNHSEYLIDPQSPHWLGNYSDNPAIHQSGLWNVDHVDKIHEQEFLSRLITLVEGM